ncbi:MAG: hypothetical protein JXB88_04005 [Spirochaetales bacterium]|nr:hypothetical protein [Spirochaetales bacterium]
MTNTENKNSKPLKIAGLGRYLPERIIPNSEIEANCDLEEGWCTRKLGISERRWIADENITHMCKQASEEAIKDAHLAKNDIDLIINASNSFDCVVPDQSLQIKKVLGIERENVECFSINCGCMSCLFALDLSSCLLLTDRYKNILVVSALVSSPGLNNKDPMLYSMMGDAAAAMVLTRSSETEKSCLYAARMETYSRATGVGGFSGKSGKKMLFSKNVFSEDFYFEFDSQTMQAEGVKYNRDFFSRLLPLKRNLIKVVIPNQASRLAIDMIKLMFPASRIIRIIDWSGNIGAVGYPMALYEAVKNKLLHRGDLTLLHGMGAGFSIYGILLKY